MPTYQYACTECDHRFEAVQSFSDDALTVCPECSGALRKVYSAVGVVFKGSGFYRTDSRANGNGSAKGAGSTSTTSTSGSTESAPKSESKSESSKPAAAASASSTGSGSAA